LKKAVNRFEHFCIALVENHENGMRKRISWYCRGISWYTQIPRHNHPILSAWFL